MIDLIPNDNNLFVNNDRKEEFEQQNTEVQRVFSSFAYYVTALCDLHLVIVNIFLHKFEKKGERFFILLWGNCYM